MTALQIGDRLNDHQIIDSLGGGNFADVFLAQHSISGAVEAVKVCKSTAKPSEIERFYRENDILHQLKTHPRVVEPRTTVLKMGDHIYFSMERLDSSLEDYLAVTPQLDLRSKIQLLKEVTEGLKYAHRQGVAHRDLWWANILLKFDQGKNYPEPKLSDFGLAKNFSVITSLNSGCSVGGYLFIVPPEIHFDVYDAVDPSKAFLSDVYALGMIFFYVMEITPSAHAIKQMNSVSNFLKAKRVSLASLTQAEKNGLYKEWLAAFVPTLDQMRISSGLDKDTSDEWTGLVSKMSHPDCDQRIADLDEVLNKLSLL